MTERRPFLAALLVLGMSGFASDAIGQTARPAEAARPADHQTLEQLLRHRILEQQAARGAVMAILSPSGRDVIVVQDDKDGGLPPLDQNSIFEIASLTKVFTALVLADDVVQGRARLSDPVQAHLPSGVQVPQFGERQITLEDLATHGSALPLWPGNLAAIAPDAPDKYAGYRLDQLYSGLTDLKLGYAPGERFRYSNLGVSLLGQALAHDAGETFPALLKARVTSPLNLSDTQFGEAPSKASRRALGFDTDLNPIAPSGEGALDPAGGLRSTANDLLAFLDLFLNGKGPPNLVRAAQLMLTVDRPGDDDATRMALGWRRSVAHGETYYWSNGSGDVSRTFMGFNPARGVAVVALADAASGGGLDDIARRVLDPQQDVDASVVPRPVTVVLPEAVLQRVLGRYQYAPDDEIEITRGVTGLIVTSGPNQFVIQPQSATHYISRMVPDVVIEFEGAEAGPATVLVVREGEQTYRYVRRY